MKLARQDPEQASLDFLWNFPETVCGSPVTLAARSHVTQGARQAAAPTGTKGPLPLHLAGLLATAGSVASQKAVPGAAHLNDMLCGGTAAAPARWAAGPAVCSAGGGWEGEPAAHLVASGQWRAARPPAASTVLSQLELWFPEANDNWPS